MLQHVSLLITLINLLQKYQQMKKQGVREDDPEYLKVHGLLSAISRESQLRRFRAQQQQEAIARQREAQQQQQGMNVVSGKCREFTEHKTRQGF